MFMEKKSEVYDLKKDSEIKKTIQTHSGLTVKIALIIFFILDIILKNLVLI